MPTLRTPGREPDPKYNALITSLAQGLIGAVQSTGQEHGAQLDGLLSAYASLLTRHPCCWEGAVWGLREFADRVDVMRAAQAAVAQQQATEAIAAASRKPA